MQKQRSWEEEEKMCRHRGEDNSLSLSLEQSPGHDEDLERVQTRGRGRSVVIEQMGDGEEDEEEITFSSLTPTPRPAVPSAALASQSEIDGSSDRNEDMGSPFRRGRQRARSIVGGAIGELGEEGESSTLEEREREEEKASALAAKAANLTKLYLAGGAPVTSLDFPPPSEGTQAVIHSPRGALTEKAIEVLSEGLHHMEFVRKGENSDPYDPVKAEEELEEEMLVSEEARRLREEKKLQEEELREEEQRRLESWKKKKEPISNRLRHYIGQALEKTEAVGEERASERSSSSFVPPLMRRFSLRSETEKKRDGETEIIETATAPSPGATAASPASASGSREGMSPRKKFKVKLLMLGDSGVGKTSIMHRWSKDAFSESMLATAGVDFASKTIHLDDGKEVAVQVWDTAGQERFRKITATYYKGANGIILAYDVSARRSFENISHWLDSIKKHASYTEVAIMLVGNKIDLQQRRVSTQEGAAFAKANGIRFFETSAREAINVNEALAAITRDSIYCSAMKGQGGQKALLKEEQVSKPNGRRDDCIIS